MLNQYDIVALEVPKVITFQIKCKMQVLLAVTIVSLLQVRSFTLSEQAKVPHFILFHCFVELLHTIL